MRQTFRISRTWVFPALVGMSILAGVPGGAGAGEPLQAPEPVPVIGGAPAPAPEPMPAPVVGGGPAPMPAAAGIVVEKTAAVGETVDIRLDGNMTTGYSWAIDTMASSGMEAVTATGEAYEAPKTDQPIAGAPGVQVFHFTAAAPGEARVVFVYRRPWMPAEIENKAEARITVK